MNQEEIKELETERVQHFCQSCHTNYCKLTRDRNCAFCKSSSLVTIESKNGIYK